MPRAGLKYFRNFYYYETLTDHSMCQRLLGARETEMSEMKSLPFTCSLRDHRDACGAHSFQQSKRPQGREQPASWNGQKDPRVGDSELRLCGLT